MPISLRSIPIALAVIVGLIISAFTFFAFERAELDADIGAFELRSEQRINSILRRIDSQLEVVRSIVSFYDSSQRVDRAEFSSFTTNPLLRSPNIQALEWIPLVPHSQRTKFESQARADGFQDFALKERRDGMLVPAGIREEYFPVYFAEPVAGNRLALGFDLGSNPVRRAALEQARDTGKLTISGKVDLVQANQDRAAILAISPIYRGGKVPTTVGLRRELIAGFALGVIRLSGFFNFADAPDEGSKSSSTDPQVFLYDRFPDGTNELLFSIDGSESDGPTTVAQSQPDQDGTTIRNLDIGGRVWSVVVRPQLGTLGVGVAWQSWAALAATLALTTLLALYLNFTIYRRRQVQALVARRTAELKRTTALLETIIDGPDLAIIATALTGTIETFNPGAERMLGYKADEVIGKREGNSFQVPQEMEEYARETTTETGETDFTTTGLLRYRAERGLPIRHDWTFVRKDGSQLPVSLSFSARHDDEGNIAGFVAIAEDTTESQAQQRKLAETTQFLETIINAVEHAVISTDNDGIIQAFNPGAEKITGYSADELVGKSNSFVYMDPEEFAASQERFAAEVGAAEAAKMPMLKDRIMAGLPIEKEWTIIRKGGERVLTNMSMTPLRDEYGAVRGFVGVLVDLSEIRSHQRQLAETTQFLETIFNAVEHAIISPDQDKIIRAFNPGAERLTGYSADEVIGKETPMLYLDQNQIDARYEQLVEEVGEEEARKTPQLHDWIDAGIPIDYNWTIIRKDGTHIPTNMSVTPTRDENGVVTGYVGVHVDISERQEQARILAETTQYLEAIFNAVEHAVISADQDGVIRAFNPSAERLTGYSSDEIIGKVSPIQFLDRAELAASYKKFADEVGEEQAKEMPTLRHRAVNYIPIEDEWTVVRKDGTRVATNMALTPLINDAGEAHGFVQVHVDITEQKEMDRMKDEFVSTVSHELRTPLTSIKGALGLIRAGATGQLPDKFTDMLEIAYSNSERLVLLINDILDVEKIEAGKMDFMIQTVDLMSLVRETIEVNQSYADQFGVKLLLIKEVASCPVRADPDRLIQVFTNLISNAAKFSPENGEIEISVTTSDSGARVSVKDNGPGVPEDFQPHIFDKFSQSDASDTRRVGGTGLGLSITKSIVESHGGSIHFDTVIGVGSTFYVDLPNLSASISDQDPGGRLPRILVCEDEPDVATAIRLFLESANYAVDVAYSGGEALELLAQTKYTAMTLDIMLPDTDGVSLIRRIRAQDETRDIPIVVVSARANETRLELNGDGVGVIDWLSKPIDEVAFAATLRRAVSNDGKRRRILHVEDDRDLTQVVSNLVGDYAEVVWADRISSARRHLARDNFDLIILDLTLPDGSGEELLGDLQTPDGQPIPVIVFSADDASAKLAGRIQAALVKSRSTEEMLLNTIRSFIAKSELPDPTNNDLSPQDNQ